MKANDRLWTDKEIEFIKKNYKKLGAKACSTKINRTPMAISRRARIVGASSRYGMFDFDKDTFIKTIKESKSIREVLTKMNLRAAGGNYKTFHKYVKKFKIDTSHFTTKEEIARNINDIFVKRPIEYYLKNNTKTSNSSLKNRLYKEG